MLGINLIDVNRLHVFIFFLWQAMHILCQSVKEIQSKNYDK